MRQVETFKNAEQGRKKVFNRCLKPCQQIVDRQLKTLLKQAAKHLYPVDNARWSG